MLETRLLHPSSVDMVVIVAFCSTGKEMAKEVDLQVLRPQETTRRFSEAHVVYKGSSPDIKAFEPLVEIRSIKLANIEVLLTRGRHFVVAYRCRHLRRRW